LNEIKFDERKIILIADDHIYIRETLKNLITKIIENKNLTYKYKIKEASDGVELIHFVIKDQLMNNKIKCILTDKIWSL